MMNPVAVDFDRGDDLVITVEVAAQEGLPTCVGYSVRSQSGGGLERQATTIARDVKLRELVEMAAGAGTMGSRQEGDGFVIQSWVPTTDPGSRLGDMTRRRRQPITDDRLRQFAADYDDRFVSGRMEEFAKSLGYSERQGWRLKQLAVERGFLHEEGS